ncbi:hypothetical protein SAMN04488099_1028 [Alkalibacterium pelagium]|jgi:hypothetical protein|uniref:Uncharacterized protein n=2 Tax=Alkalibacterium pelagium TaxID=426702 RepID=A0A1H7G047_9LACT|nr:hypothetical protein SAMN04488099_1028 [Alkalibacterium pelagium]
MKSKSEIPHPEHSTWWDRHERKVILYLFVSMIILLTMPFFIIPLVIEAIWIGILWLILFFIHSFLFLILSPRKKDLM